MPPPQYGDCRILPCQLPRQGVDLRLALGDDGGQISTIPFEECRRIRCLSTPIAGLLSAELRDQRRHAAGDLPLDQVELMLGLPARLLHAEELCTATNWQH